MNQGESHRSMAECPSSAAVAPHPGRPLPVIIAPASLVDNTQTANNTQPYGSVAHTDLHEALVKQVQALGPGEVQYALWLAMANASDARTLARYPVHVFTPTRALQAMSLHLARANAHSGHSLEVARLCDAINAWGCSNDEAAHLALTGGAPLTAGVA
jgi:hypothetical protein